MTLDPLSDLLSLTNAETAVSGGFVTSGAWSLRFPGPNKIKFFALVKGCCWLCVDGQESPALIEQGDIFLLAAPRAFILASDLSVPPLDANQIFSAAQSNVARIGDSDDCFMIGGHVLLDPANGGLLADVMPPLIHVRASAPQATVLQWLLGQLLHEHSAERPGAELASAQLAQLMFIQILRVHLETSGPLAAGLLRAVSDPQIAPALRLMHSQPGRPWQLRELAQAAAMSRTSFAQRFKLSAGVAPLTYLTQWRMRLAERALRDSDTSVSDIAQSLGYTSESAFSNAFKRATGQAPRPYRSAMRATKPQPQ